MNKILITSLIIFCFTITINAQYHKVLNHIDWNGKITLLEDNVAINNVQETGNYSTEESFTKANGKFSSITYAAISELEQAKISNFIVSNSVSLEINIAYERKKPVIQYSFLPFRINPETNKIEKVIEYEISFTLLNNKLKSASSRKYTDNSLLKSGNWYKIKIDTTGIFKLTYSQLTQIGLSKPENVRVYSYGGKQLAYANSDFNHDDLVEIPIKMNKGSDNTFGEYDYIFFYAEGPITWNYNSGIDMFLHSKHNFSNYTYIFISDFLGSGGLKITEIDNTSLQANYTSSSFDSYQCHEINKYNLIESGRTWFGEKFRPGTAESFNFAFPNIISSEKVKIHTTVAGRKQLSSQTCYFDISNNTTNLGKIEITGVYGTYKYAQQLKRAFEISNPSSSINLNYSFVGNSSNMEGYLDYICLNAREKLKMHGSQFLFRDKNTVDSGRISQFNMDNNGKDLQIWNISNAVNPYQLKFTEQGNTLSFALPTDTLEQFIAFDGSNYFTPIIDGDDLGLVQNQNLHGEGFYDMVIVTHPMFQAQADTLAKIHRENDNLSVLVTQPQTIYNEFSSGTPDVSAIRNFMRMLYDKASTDDELPQYLLLFGDGSYDNWSLDNGNSNFIPTYQSVNSVSETASYVSDDYFGLLDLGEGEIDSGIYGKLELGIGRFPVQTEDEADLMIEKVKHYMSPESFGNWKTKICFIGDDEDSAIHMEQADYIANNIIRVQHPEYNNDKIYLDAYKQISTPAGQRFPDATIAINEKVEQGALIVDYVGHGNPRILAHEEILSVTDVRSWNNWDKLSVFVTASCEVGRFDDYQRVSFGEWILLNPTGGGIAAITTTRVVYSGENNELSKALFRNVLDPDLRIGDIVRLAKNDRSASSINHRNFSLLGDPALKISVPTNKIVIGIINENFLPVKTETSLLNIEGNPDFKSTVLYEPGDTLYALSKAKVQGYINDVNGDPLNKDGELFITVYDKTDTLNTYGQDNTSMEFTLQNNILYKGKASINQGVFSFEFIVPKDINYKFGAGKISLYAVLDTLEAIGYSENIIIGGNAKSVSSDDSGPAIELYMNDTLFQNGGTTNENPIFIAQLKDTTGINTTGNGFGHNITAILDGNQDNVYILNNYYEGYLDKYNSGEVRYPFSDLIPGYHHIAFKSFDIYNNSSEAELEFYVHEGNDLVIDNMYNVPNPFYDATEFRFEHNQSFDAFEINIRIYDLMGNKVTELTENNLNNGFAITPIKWNGTNAVGAKLPEGIYIYRTEITATDGRKTYKSSKLMIFR